MFHVSKDRSLHKSVDESVSNLNAEHKERDGPSINHSLGQLYKKPTATFMST